MLPLDIRIFIKENIDLIEKNEFDLLYQKAVGTQGIMSPGILTDALLAADIHPLQYLDTIPPLYFEGSQQTTFIVPSHIKAARAACFAYSNLEQITFHNNCELLHGCCHNSSLKSVKIPNIMNEVPDECFYNCTELTEVDLNDVEQIGSEAFAYCEKLDQIFIPDNINFIAPSAFDKTITLLIHKDNDYVIDYATKNKIKVKFL